MRRDRRGRIDLPAFAALAPRSNTIAIPVPFFFFFFYFSLPGA